MFVGREKELHFLEERQERGYRFARVIDFEKDFVHLHLVPDAEYGTGQVGMFEEIERVDLAVAHIIQACCPAKPYMLIVEEVCHGAVGQLHVGQSDCLDDPHFVGLFAFGKSFLHIVIDADQAIELFKTHKDGNNG